MYLLGGLSSSLLLPGFLSWSRVKSLAVCCMLYMTVMVITLFTYQAWLFRLTEVLSGLTAGISLPLIHIYSSEVFTGKRSSTAVLKTLNDTVSIQEVETVPLHLLAGGDGGVRGEPRLVSLYISGKSYSINLAPSIS